LGYTNKAITSNIHTLAYLIIFVRYGIRAPLSAEYRRIDKKYSIYSLKRIPIKKRVKI
jgi:hypothetical protein